jgi:hypothetical protein
MVFSKHSTGRGGAGNIIRDTSRSQSRSRSRGPAALHSTGRGGAGSIKSGDLTEVTIQEVDDQERLAHHHESGMYVSHAACLHA